MWRMTNTAAILGNRRMDKFAGTNCFIVTFITELRARTFELELIGGLMWIVTPGTIAVRNRLMHNGTSIQFLMTLVTKGLNILDRLKSVLVFLSCR